MGYAHGTITLRDILYFILSKRYFKKEKSMNEWRVLLSAFLHVSLKIFKNSICWLVELDMF